MTDHDGILFLCDRSDELARDLQKKSLVADILNHKAYPKSSYIITSCPLTTAQLPTQGVQQMDRIETQGFTKDKIKQFIQQCSRQDLTQGRRSSKSSSPIPSCVTCAANLVPYPLLVYAIARGEQMLPDRMSILLKS